MATIYIAEFAAMAAVGTHTAPIPATPSVANQKHTLTTTSTTSNTFSARTTFVEVATDTASFILFGTTTASITASNTSIWLPANTTRWYGVAPGGVIAAVSA